MKYNDKHCFAYWRCIRRQVLYNLNPCFEPYMSTPEFQEVFEDWWWRQKFTYGSDPVFDALIDQGYIKPEPDWEYMENYMERVCAGLQDTIDFIKYIVDSGKDLLTEISRDKKKGEHHE